MSTDDIGRDSSRGHYSIAMLAPPWAPITSESRDVERAIGLLCAGLVERGHRVTLFAAPGTRCSATVHEIVQPYGLREVGSAPFETDYVARFFDTFRHGAAQDRSFDIVHDHCGLSVIAMADWLSDQMLERGLILRNDGRNDPTTQLCPPLVVTKEECDYVVNVLAECFDELGKKLGTVGKTI